MGKKPDLADRYRGSIAALSRWWQRTAWSADINPLRGIMAAKENCTMPHRPSKSELRARDRLLYNLYYLQRDDFIDITLRDQVPEAWHTLELDVECSEPKEKITLYLDRSVVRLFRAMGRGYQGRINRLLSTWAQMKIAGEVALEKNLKARLANPNARF